MQNTHIRFRLFNLFLLLSCLVVSSVEMQGHDNEEEHFYAQIDEKVGEEEKITNDSQYRLAHKSLAIEINNQKKRRDKMDQICEDVDQFVPDLIIGEMHKFKDECKEIRFCKKKATLLAIIDRLTSNGTDPFEMLNRQMLIADKQILNKKKEIDAYPVYIRNIVDEFLVKYYELRHYISSDDLRYEQVLLNEAKALYDDAALFVSASSETTMKLMSEAPLFNTDAEVEIYIKDIGLWDKPSNLKDIAIGELITRIKTRLDDKIADGKLAKISHLIDEKKLTHLKNTPKVSEDKNGNLIFPYYDAVQELFEQIVQNKKENLRALAEDNPEFVEYIKMGIAQADRPENETYDALDILQNKIKEKINKDYQRELENDSVRLDAI